MFDRHTILYFPFPVVLAKVSEPSRSFYEALRSKAIQKELDQRFRARGDVAQRILSKCNPIAQQTLNQCCTAAISGQ